MDIVLDKAVGVVIFHEELRIDGLSLHTDRNIRGAEVVHVEMEEGRDLVPVREIFLFVRIDVEVGIRISV